MKNILDQIKNGNLSEIGNTINSALGGNLGGSIQQASQNLGNVGSMAKEKVQSSNLGGVGGLLGSAAVGGLLGALFTGKKTKKVAKTAMKVGGAAAIGGLAWTFYQKWSQSKESTAGGYYQPQANQQYQQNSQNYQAPQGYQEPVYQEAQVQNTPPQMLPPAENTALLLLEAMVYAARADGHIDEDERNNIHNAVAALFPNQDMAEIVDAFIQKPIDPHSLASRVVSKEEGYDLYRLSCAAVDIDSYMERSYLDGLANALAITKEEQAQLEKEAEDF